MAKSEKHDIQVKSVTMAAQADNCSLVASFLHVRPWAKQSTSTIVPSATLQVRTIIVPALKMRGTETRRVSQSTEGHIGARTKLVAPSLTSLLAVSP